MIKKWMTDKVLLSYLQMSVLSFDQIVLQKFWTPKVAWANICTKISEYPPSGELHDIGNIYGSVRFCVGSVGQNTFWVHNNFYDVTVY